MSRSVLLNAFISGFSCRQGVVYWLFRLYGGQEKHFLGLTQ